MKQQLKETSISKDSLEFEVGKFYASGATASQYIKSKRGEQSIALMDWYNDNAEMELKKDAEFICEAVNNYNALKDALNLAQAEIRAMYKRVGINGSNVLDLIDNLLKTNNETICN